MNEKLSYNRCAVQYNVQQKTWRLVNNHSYKCNGSTLTAKAGYTFDLASIPRFFWRLIAPYELSLVAPLFHDLLYEYQGKLPDKTYVKPYKIYTRKETDRLFLDIMKLKGVSYWRRNLAYFAVRLFGWKAWNDLG